MADCVCREHCHVAVIQDCVVDITNSVNYNHTMPQDVGHLSPVLSSVLILESERYLNALKKKKKTVFHSTRVRSAEVDLVVTIALHIEDDSKIAVGEEKLKLSYSYPGFRLLNLDT